LYYNVFYPQDGDTLALIILVALATECFIVPLERSSDQFRDINNYVADTTPNISHYSI